MPDIDPAALSRTDIFAQPLPNSSAASKANGAASLSLQKTAKTFSSAPRIDLEPLYTNLKVAIGDHWAEYKVTLTEFLLGELNQDEFCLRTNYFLHVDPLNEHLHNQLIAGILANVPRDLPDGGVAPWVSANDKPATLSKALAGDASEQRLKTETMQLPARDRRRLKEMPEPEQLDPITASFAQYHAGKQFRSADQVSSTAGGFNRTNWDLEIRKRYANSLAFETGEFPDAETIQSRMVPICYEESLPNGCSAPCAGFMATATEHYIKEVLSSIYTKTRSNMPSGSVKSILTHRFKKQLAAEEEAASRGEIVRAPATGLLPVEVKQAAGRLSLSMADLRLAIASGNSNIGHFPHIIAKIHESYQDGEYEVYMERKYAVEEAKRAEADAEKKRLEALRQAMHDAKTNGVNGINGIRTQDDDEDEGWGWEGGGAADRGQLSAIIDECIVFGQ